MNKWTGYKANLLQNARYQMERTGGSISIRKDHVTFTKANGQSCVVWYPVESRVNDLEIYDLKQAIEYYSGYKAFTL